MNRSHRTASVALDALDRAILNRLQDGFPLTPDPFADVAREFNCDADELVARLKRLHAENAITRFGPFIDTVAMGGAFCLCAMAVPVDRFERITEIVNGFHQVAHNYERDHKLNMWFVLGTATPGEIDTVADEIEQATCLRVHRFPKLEEYFVGFRVAA
ncbi:MAG: AsnC family transcriptional regulator [Alphaproteobacteria bacterium]|nr:AsnC family transcriptional regulator [Alphaproteobacteria bacterium]